MPKPNQSGTKKQAHKLHLQRKRAKIEAKKNDDKKNKEKRQKKTKKKATKRKKQLQKRKKQRQEKAIRKKLFLDLNRPKSVGVLHVVPKQNISEVESRLLMVEPNICQACLQTHQSNLCRCIHKDSTKDKEPIYRWKETSRGKDFKTDFRPSQLQTTGELETSFKPDGPKPDEPKPEEPQFSGIACKVKDIWKLAGEEERHQLVSPTIPEKEPTGEDLALLVVFCNNPDLLKGGSPIFEKIFLKNLNASKNNVVKKGKHHGSRGTQQMFGTKGAHHKDDLGNTIQPHASKDEELAGTLQPLLEEEIKRAADHVSKVTGIDGLVEAGNLIVKLAMGATVKREPKLASIVKPLAKGFPSVTVSQNAVTLEIHGEKDMNCTFVVVPNQEHCQQESPFSFNFCLDGTHGSCIEIPLFVGVSVLFSGRCLCHRQAFDGDEHQHQEHLNTQPSFVNFGACANKKHLNFSQRTVQRLDKAHQEKSSGSSKFSEKTLERLEKATQEKRPGDTVVDVVREFELDDVLPAAAKAEEALDEKDEDRQQVERLARRKQLQRQERRKRLVLDKWVEASPEQVASLREQLAQAVRFKMECQKSVMLTNEWSGSLQRQLALRQRSRATSLGGRS